ncbi:MAG: cation transporter [Verrucomicrobia bacterium RIFCSPLOWO2_12_FULL_64_8]|nr:MAG: cation transporter [Verrucomicrobia bacterium RIFCSPLOWO2_12_FULL_64_8]
MLERLIEFSVRRQPIILLATAVLVVLGVWSAARLPMDAVPDITNVQVQVNTAVPALAPEETEQQVTFPLENRLSGLPGVIEFRSLSKAGLSQVTLVFADGTDIYRARQLVSERLQAAAEDLPPGLTPRLSPIATGLGEIFYYTIDYAPGAPNLPATRREQLLELRALHESIVKPALRRTPGVAEINTSGGYEKQIVIQPDPQRLFDAGLTLSEFADRIAENMRNAGGGSVEIGAEQVAIRAISRPATVEEIGALPLKFTGAVRPLVVRDVAAVGIGAGFRTGAATVDGREALVGAAIMLAGGNSRLVARAVGGRLAELQHQLPAGVKLRPLYDRSHLVNRTIRTVGLNLTEGALLVVAILFALIGNARAALIVALAIPLAMLFAAIGMTQLGIPGNLMSLGAIDFGLIVDGAIVMVENVVRHLAHRQRALGRALTRDEQRAGVLAAGREVARPMFFGVLVITLVYVPILALQGIEGKMFEPMAVVVMLALGGALVLALTLMPALCSLVLGGRIREGDSGLVRLAKRLYGPLLDFGLRRRRLVVLALVTLFAGSLWVFGRLGGELLPELDEGDFTAFMVRSTSAGLEASLEMQNSAEHVLHELFPEITHTFSRVGTDEIAQDPMNPNVSDAYIMLKPHQAWRRAGGRPIAKEALAGLMARELSQRIPGQTYLFSQPIEMRFNEILEGTRADVAIKIFGPDYATLERLAGEVLTVLQGVPGGGDIEPDAIGQAPVLEILARRDALVRYNLDTNEINTAVESAFAGVEVGRFIEGNRRVPVVVRLSDNLRADVAAVRRLPVGTHDGGLLTLGQVADVRDTLQVSIIVRENSQRRVAVLVSVRGRDLAGYVAEARARLAGRLKLPEGYQLEFGGQFQNLVEAKRRLAIVVPLALGLIFSLIVLSFGRFRQAALVFVCVPLAATGGVAALWLRGMPFTISAAVGFIALSGVAVLNGIMLISFINQLRAEGRPLDAACREGTLTRLRPLLMTALVASLGFVPMALSTGAGAEVQRPLATVVIGGIVSATFLTLIVLPVLYAWVEQRAAAAASPPSPPT